MRKICEKKHHAVRIFLIGLDPAVAAQIGKVLSRERHRVEHRSEDIEMSDLMAADIIFAGGEASRYLAVLRRVRNVRPAVPFFVATRMPSTMDWLDALEAGATDYCSAPFEPRRVNWLMESALSGWGTASLRPHPSISADCPKPVESPAETGSLPLPRMPSTFESSSSPATKTLRAAS
jgi:DNA-binding response OmpR family regulator